MVTLNDIAKKAGVSTSTASPCVSGKRKHFTADARPGVSSGKGIELHAQSAGAGTQKQPEPPDWSGYLRYREPILFAHHKGDGGRAEKVGISARSILQQRRLP